MRECVKRPSRIVIFYLILLGCLQACSDDLSVQQLPDLEARRAREPRSEIYGFSYQFNELGRPKAIIRSPHAREYQRFDTGETEFHLKGGVEVYFYDSLGQSTSYLKAQQATLFQNRGYAEAVGNVEWINSKGEKLETERLRWFRQLNQISTPEFVKITTPKDVLYGDSLTANLSFSSYRIFKIRGQFLLNEID